MPANENLNQNAQNVWNGNNVQVQSGTNSVNFNNNAQNSCLVTFGNSATFNVSSVNVPAGQTINLPIYQRVSTTMTLPGSAIEGAQYTISVDTPQNAGVYGKTA